MSGESQRKTYPSLDNLIADLERRLGGRLYASWEYPKPQGADEFWQLRFERANGKTYRPAHEVNGRWLVGAPPGPLPLFRRDEVLEHDGGFACVSEGELCVEKLWSLGLPATTNALGAQGVGRTDWRPLAALQREIILFPDNDPAGESWLQKVVETLRRLDPDVILKVVRLPGVPEKGDIVDFVALGKDEGKTHEEIEGQVRERIQSAESVPVWELRSRFRAQLDAAAFHGLAGDIVRAIEPHTEADPVAVLVDTVVSFGSAAGRHAYFEVDGTKHYPNLFATLVGTTSKGRKGTSRAQVARVFEGAEPTWSERCLAHGLSTGEGLIASVRDKTTQSEAIRDENGNATGEYVEVDAEAGVEDKRLLVVEPELARVLKAARRDANTLSPTVRQAWDTGDLRILTKTSPMRATGAHISLLAHITKEELLRELSSTEAANGYGNRWLWLWVERSKCLPLGGKLQGADLGSIQERLRTAVEFARVEREIHLDADARDAWLAIYPELSEGKPGLVGALTSRAEAQVRRLAMIYALLDLSSVVRLEHLLAALALWEYCEASVRFVFGDSMGDNLADEILEALRGEGAAGMSRTDVRDALNRHKSAAQIKAALSMLEDASLARMERHPTKGRAQERWYACATEATKADEPHDFGRIGRSSRRVERAFAALRSNDACLTGHGHHRAEVGVRW